VKTVAIFGAGLIGGSFALALKRAGFTGEILGVSSNAALTEALRLRIIDAAASEEQAAAEADLIYLAQPVGRILAILERLNAHVKPSALITDAGSTKAAIVEKAERYITRCQFLGGHPLAGKETRGVGAAEAEMFAGRTYVLTPTRERDLETGAAREFVDWLRRIGSIPRVYDARRHDEVVAFTSHLPQLCSTALAATLAEVFASGRSEAEAASGLGLRDTTRLALSSFDIWADILATNSKAVLGALDEFIRRLSEIRGKLGSEPAELRPVFELAADFALAVRGDTGTETKKF